MRTRRFTDLAITYNETTAPVAARSGKFTEPVVDVDDELSS